MAENNFTYKFSGSGLNETERKKANKRFEAYRANYPHLNKYSNLPLLEQLVWQEEILERFKDQVGKLGINKVTNAPEVIPSHLQDSITSSLNDIISLKTKLGMFEDAKVLEAYKDFIDYVEKAKVYRRAHPLQFKTTCIHCGKIYFLKRRTDKFEEFNSPFFEDKILNNRPLFQLWKDGIITREKVAEILGTSPDYVDWLDEKIYGNVKKQEKKNEQPVTEVKPEEPPSPPPEDQTPKE